MYISVCFYTDTYIDIHVCLCLYVHTYIFIYSYRPRRLKLRLLLRLLRLRLRLLWERADRRGSGKLSIGMIIKVEGREGKDPYVIERLMNWWVS